MIEFLKIVVLGIVEGFTEWLPISSTGHMILVDEIIHLNVSNDFKAVFEVVIQLGAIFAVVLLYFRKLNPFDSQKNMKQRRAAIQLWFKIFIACIPAAVIGLLLNDWMEEHLYNAVVVSAMLIIYGVFFILMENRNGKREFPIRKVTQISWLEAFYIGGFQLLALIPGTSRSGVTILGAMLLGCSRSCAAEFSFFLSVPVMFGASLLKVVKFGFHFSGTEIFYLVSGMAIAFVVSVYSITFLMSFIKRNSFRLFGYYRIVLGVIVLAYFGVRALTA